MRTDRRITAATLSLSDSDLLTPFENHVKMKIKQDL